MPIYKYRKRKLSKIPLYKKTPRWCPPHNLSKRNKKEEEKALSVSRAGAGYEDGPINEGSSSFRKRREAAVAYADQWHMQRRWYLGRGLAVMGSPKRWMAERDWRWQLTQQQARKRMEWQDMMGLFISRFWVSWWDMMGLLISCFWGLQSPAA